MANLQKLKEIEDQLEAMIDRYSLRDVVNSLEIICHGKADHLRSNWQDDSTARVWEKAATACDSLYGKLAKLGV